MATHSPASRFASLDDAALLRRRAEVIERMAVVAPKAAAFAQWSREDPNACFGQGLEHRKRSGTSVSPAVGRAMGRMKDDARIIEELTAELSERGYTDAEMDAEYEKHYAAGEREALRQADAALGIGDASFTVVGDEVQVPITVVRSTRRGKRDRLAWVPFMQALAAQYELSV